MGDRTKALDIFCRPRVDSDLAALTGLWLLAWQKAMPSIDFEARRGWFLDHLLALEANGFQTICAFDPQGAALGFVTVHPKTHDLDQLAATPDAWGLGIASRLLGEARLLSPQALSLDVNADNPRAIRFYEREGFVRSGEGINALSGLRTLRMLWKPRSISNV